MLSGEEIDQAKSEHAKLAVVRSPQLHELWLKSGAKHTYSTHVTTIHLETFRIVMPGLWIMGLSPLLIAAKPSIAGEMGAVSPKLLVEPSDDNLGIT
eukprot:6477109-Amphidinium_carterae.1